MEPVSEDSLMIYILFSLSSSILLKSFFLFWSLTWLLFEFYKLFFILVKISINQKWRYSELKVSLFFEAFQAENMTQRGLSFLVPNYVSMILRMITPKAMNQEITHCSFIYAHFRFHQKKPLITTVMMLVSGKVPLLLFIIPKNKVLY